MAAIAAGITTFLTLSGSNGFTNDPNAVLALLVLDLALLLVLGGIVVWRVAKLWAERRAGRGGVASTCAAGVDVRRLGGGAGLLCW